MGGCEPLNNKTNVRFLTDSPTVRQALLRKAMHVHVSAVAMETHRCCTQRCCKRDVKIVAVRTHFRSPYSSTLIPSSPAVFCP
jgi:hypothetical protein